jgi:hypothetical protein
MQGVMSLLLGSLRVYLIFFFTFMSISLVK